MHEQAAKTLIKDTFQQSYDLGRFREFVSNLMKVRKSEQEEENEFRGTSAIVPDNFKDSIKSVYRIATLKDGDGNDIDLLAVTLARDTSLDRARTMQRNFLARHLSRRDKEAALVAFVSPDSNSWRFSLVRRELSLTRNLKGITKTVQDFSPARRFSFLVGKGEHTHTAQRQLIELLKSDVRPSLKTLEKAFNIEQVTEEFFEEYRELFGRANDVIKDCIEKHPAIKSHFIEKDIESADFAKRLLGQIVFLYFLQKKGWLGVPLGKKWGEGSRTFLRDLYSQCETEGGNFFHKYLQPLFYEALNRDHSDNQHYHKLFDSRIPFLNGGLFEPYHDYDWAAQDIKLPNSLFHELGSSLFGEDGRGILDVFDRYNFTVAEDEPLEREVAIDPEMLGKVFEKLLPVKERGKLGTFYTPREIVHYMCQESLIAYLASRFPALDKTDLDDFIRYGDLLMEHDSKILRDGANGTYKDYFLGPTIRANLKAIDDALKHVKVCDPAIGSGAFPVGMMSEIVRARKVLAAHLRQERPSYDLKRETIQESLYGVDIDPGAIEIAKLRLWLSLVVDEDNFDDIQALPNLDYKIMQGNSLLQSYEGIKLFEDTLLKQHDHTSRRRNQLESEFKEMQERFVAFVTGSETISNQKERTALEKALRDKKKEIENYLEKAKTQEDTPLFANAGKAVKLAERLKNLHAEFFDTDRPKKKKELKAEIESLEWQLIETSLCEQNKAEKIPDVQKLQRHNVKPYFLWKLHFNEVFADENGGFDIVIANPPYVSHDRIDNKLTLRDTYNSYEPFADLYCYFIELAINILSSFGTLAYITSNSYLRADYGGPVRTLIHDNTNIRALINIERSQVFDSAIVNTAILLTSKGGNETSSMVVHAEMNDQNFLDFIDKNKSQYNKTDFETKSWTLISSDQIHLLKKLEANGAKLKDLNAKIRLGIATGSNEAFLISNEKAKELINSAPQNADIIKPVLRGREIQRYCFAKPTQYLLLTKNGMDVPNDYPAVMEHFESFGKKFKNRGAKGRHWTNLRACAFFDDFILPKIIWIELTDRGRFALCTEEIYLINSAYFMLIPEQFVQEYLLGLLNSRTIHFYLKSTAETSGMGTTRWINNYVQEFPIPLISRQKQKPIADMVLEITALKKQNPSADVSALEAAINAEVYRLYHLTPAEIALIEQAVP